MQSPCLWCNHGNCPFKFRVNQNVVQGLYDEVRIVLSELQGYCYGVLWSFCSSVCLFDQIRKPNAERCWYRDPPDWSSCYCM